MSGGPGRVDWPALMQAGMCGLSLSPEAFWRLTPAELRLLLGGAAGSGAVLGRKRLDELLAAYPDTGGRDADNGGEDDGGSWDL
ncbi:rcc01693 family protein [Pseudooceanicola algae]|uniref:Phage tail assembly chaperone n=1 Tax=Pseudooceanicola algae TaxID=1537215 RepID=A0A418SBZ6_9RHOB|nr:rcc01693 family protein [Pseudooceanicola algae]QPM89921.1 hypothetical protein PSAL_011510 [Pseudooceanicola algae]